MTINLSQTTTHFESGTAPQNFRFVERVFHDKIEPIYGSQADALAKIRQSADRRCWVLYDETIPVGLVNYKTAPSDEYASLGVANSLELKTLVLADPSSSGKRGFGTLLLERVKEAAKRAMAQSIHVTVSNDRQDALAFFQKKNFKVIHQFPGLYKPGVTENLLAYHFPKQENIPMATLTPHVTPSSRASLYIKPVRGQGREDRMRIVESYLKSNEKGALLSDIENGIVKCRLLYDGHKPVGIFAYEDSRSDKFKDFGFEKSVTIRVLSTLNTERADRTERQYVKVMLQEIEEMSQDLNPYGIAFIATRVDALAAQCLADSGFSRFDIDGRSENALYAKSYLKPKREEDFPIQRKRRAEEAIPVETIQKRAKPMIQATLKKVYIHQIRRGAKTIEGRINNGMFRGITAGSTIRFFYTADHSDDVQCKITKVVAYRSFREMLENETIERCLPGVKQLDEAVAIYDAIPNYTQRAREHGVLAIHLEPMRK